MALSLQYSTDGGSTWQQFGLSTADITSHGNIVSDVFNSIKDNNDNLYVLCQRTSNSTWGYLPIVKITKQGIVTTSRINIATEQYISGGYANLAISRDGDTLFIGFFDGLYTVDLKTLSSTYVLTQIYQRYVSKFAIYQDRYIWVASGTTVKIYDYDTKAVLASVGVGFTSNDVDIVVDTNNVLYVQGYSSGVRPLYKVLFNGVSTLTTALLSSDTGAIGYKQILIDKYGDLIILTNTGTASTLLKYTTAGVQIGTEPLVLGGAFYNLNTDKEGNYYYSNALGTYKITANTAQGQAFTGVGSKIRSNGLTTYGNNISGYSPAVFGEQ